MPDPCPYPRLTVWVLVSNFPSLTTTFLLRRIQGLIARGFSVHLIAEERNRKVTPSAEHTALLPLVRWAFPEGKSWRALRAALPTVAAHHPTAAWQAWDLLRFRNLAGMRLLGTAAVIHDLPWMPMRNTLGDCVCGTVSCANGVISSCRSVATWRDGCARRGWTRDACRSCTRRSAVPNSRGSRRSR